MILNQLRSRQIAVEQIETYARQETAAAKERELRETQARAEQQRNITESELNITVQSNQGKAEYQRALQQAAQIRALAEAEAERIARTGIAQAIATEEQVQAYGGPQYPGHPAGDQPLCRSHPAGQGGRCAAVWWSAAAAGGHGVSGSSLMEGLLTLLLSDKMGVPVADEKREHNPEAERLRSQIRQNLMENRGSPGAAGCQRLGLWSEAEIKRVTAPEPLGNLHR